MNKPVSPSNAHPSEREAASFFKEVLLGHKGAVVQFLDTYPAAIEEKDNYGLTALAMTAEAGLADMAALLLGRGACVDAEAKYGTTPLMWAAEDGYDDVIKLLLEKGADVNHIDNDGETALMLATRNGCKSTVELLLENGASFDAKNPAGETALTIARQGYNPDQAEDVADMVEEGVVALLEQWPEKQKRRLAEQQAQFLKDTDFSKGLEKPIPKPRLFKLPPPKG